jgi:uncharacterized membrane protein
MDGASEVEGMPDQKRTLRARLLATAELRDAVLFGATACYVCGYLTWAVYSADRELGVLPPLEGQYFLAGIIPMMLAGGAFGLLRLLRPLKDASRRERAQRIGDRAVQLLALLIGAGVVLRWTGLVSDQQEDLLVSLLTLGSVMIGVLQARGGGTGARWLLGVFRAIVTLLVPLTAIVYATRLFPFLGAEFGGPAPKCIQLDLLVSHTSAATLASLGASPEAGGSVRSTSVWLQFAGGGVLIVSEQNKRPVKGVIRLRESQTGALLPAGGCR